MQQQSVRLLELAVQAIKSREQVIGGRSTGARKVNCFLISVTKFGNLPKVVDWFDFKNSFDVRASPDGWRRNHDGLGRGMSRPSEALPLNVAVGRLFSSGQSFPVQLATFYRRDRSKVKLCQSSLDHQCGKKRVLQGIVTELRFRTSYDTTT